MEDYTLLHQLGEGNYGQVYLINYNNPLPNMPQTLALKIINKPHQSSSLFYNNSTQINSEKSIDNPSSPAQLVMLEPQLLQSLDHPNITKLYHTEVSASHVSLFLEYVDKGDLSQQPKPVPVPTLTNWVAQVAMALHYLHSEAKIIHRDLKLQNILLSTNGLIKLADFGISRKLQLNEEFTRTALGTPFFMSPEMVRGSNYDFKTDIWGFGCCLYELCTAGKPFQGPSVKDLLYKIQYVRVPDINQNSQIVYPQWLVQLCQSMLQKDPAHRPDTQAILEIPEVAAEAQAIRNKYYPLYERNFKSNGKPLLMHKPSFTLSPLSCCVQQHTDQPNGKGYPTLSISPYPKTASTKSITSLLKPTSRSRESESTSFAKSPSRLTVPAHSGPRLRQASSTSTNSQCHSPLLNPVVTKQLNSNKSSVARSPATNFGVVSMSTRSAHTNNVLGGMTNTFTKLNSSNNLGATNNNNNSFSNAPNTTKIDERFYQRSLKFMIQQKKRQRAARQVKQPSITKVSAVRAYHEKTLSITIQEQTPDNL